MLEDLNISMKIINTIGVRRYNHLQSLSNIIVGLNGDITMKTNTNHFWNRHDTTKNDGNNTTV